MYNIILSSKKALNPSKPNICDIQVSNITSIEMLEETISKIREYAQAVFNPRLESDALPHPQTGEFDE